MDFLMDDLGIWRRLLNDSEVLRIYNAGRAGIDLASVPAVIGPFIASASPTDGATGVDPAIVFRAVIQNNITQVVTNSIQLYFDGAQVQPDIQPSSVTNTMVEYDPPGLLASNSAHNVQLIFTDNSSPATTRTDDFQFTVLAYANKILPDPIYFEDFENVALGGIPAG